MKTCIHCHTSKCRSEFHKDKSKKDGLVSKCRDCAKVYQRKYYTENRERLLEYQSSYAKENPTKVSEANKKRYLKNISQYRRERKERYWRDREENIRKSCEYLLDRVKVDPFYRFKIRCRKRVWAAFNEKGYSKKTKTFELVGCSQEYLIKYIEARFHKGMTWDNYGEWHLDHLIPFSAAENELEVELLCHYLNLQPLWASDNISKSASYCENHKKRKIAMIRRAREHASSRASA